MDKKSLAVSKKYTEDSLDGVGALKGAPCEILSIENNDDGTHTITYQWTSNSGKILQNTMVVKDSASAYALAVESGYEGTLEEWLLSLEGDKGDKGDTGVAYIEELTDVDLTNLQNGQVLKYNSTPKQQIRRIRIIMLKERRKRHHVGTDR